MKDFQGGKVQTRILVYVGLIAVLVVVFNILLVYFFNTDMPQNGVLAGVAIGSIIMVLLLFLVIDLVQIRRQGKKTEQKLGELFVSNTSLIDTVFLFFDSSFLVMNYAVYNSNGRSHSLEETKEQVAGFYKEHEFETIKNLNQSNIHDRYSGSETGQIDEMILHNRNIVLMLSAAQEKIPDDIFERIECMQKNVAFNNLIARVINSYDFYSELIHEFFNAIIVDLTGSSQPLSVEILAIKEKATDFISKIATWEQELTNSTSDKNFSRLIGFYERQNAKFGTLFKSISENYHNLENRLVSLSATVNRMFSKSSEIRGIAEKINILSINASIEAARSNEAGKGFKVIASEINKLADLTHTIINEVLSIMSDVHDEIESTKKEFRDEGDSISGTIKTQQTEFEYFYLILTSFESYFKSIFESVRSLTGEIDVHINKFNPLFQLHEIAIQEMENLNKIINSFLGEQAIEMHKLNAGFQFEEREDFIKELIQRFEKQSISQLELNALEKVVEYYKFGESITISKGSSEIEIF